MNGMGAWSSDLPHMWRLSIADLKACAIPTNGRHNPQYHEPKAEKAPAHINILEFFGIFIELWFLMRSLKETSEANPSTVPPGGFRILALADNTSALSWLQYATRTKRPVVRRLARLLTAFLSSPFPAALVRVQGKHLPGLENTAADLLSRFELAPSWESAMQQSPLLLPLPTCQVPHVVLSSLAYLINNEPTEAWFETKMTELWTVELRPFTHGSSRLQGTQTSLYHA